MTEVKILVDRWYQRVDDRRVLHRKGDVIDVAPELVAWMEQSGIGGNPKEDIHVAPPEEPVPEAPVDEPEKPEAPARPLNAANRAAWDAYAKKVGVDSSKYKTKEELIAALP